jgi:hypothetical protein
MEDAENKKKAAAAAAAAAATATASKVAAGSGGGEGGGGHWTSGEDSGRGRNENHAPWNGVGQLGGRGGGDRGGFGPVPGLLGDNVNANGHGIVHSGGERGGRGGRGSRGGRGGGGAAPGPAGVAARAEAVTRSPAGVPGLTLALTSSVPCPKFCRRSSWGRRVWLPRTVPPRSWSWRWRRKVTRAWCSVTRAKRHRSWQARWHAQCRRTPR